jgi:cytochrome c biogenesis protein
LSTAPPDPGTRGGSRPRRRFGLPLRLWRQLTSMRTALQLLFLLALAAIPGSLLPQRAVQPLQVQRYLIDHPHLGPIFDRLSLFDVFAAPWFAAIYGLLFISLSGCLVPRIRLHLKALRSAPPKAPAHPGRLRFGQTFTTTLPPQEVVQRAGSMLRRMRWRVASTDETVSAEKGYLRETGNLLFHIALLILLAGIGLGSVFGYSGTVLVVQGDGFTNGLISYDQFKAGALINTDKLSPWNLHLDKFDATYLPSGEPSTFGALVTAHNGLNAAARTDTIKVNHPLSFGSAKVYLIGHGYAPRFTVRDAQGQIVFQQQVPCTPRDSMFTSTCVVKVPDTGLPPTKATPGHPSKPQQFAFDGVFFPTEGLSPSEGFVSTFPALSAPGITIRALVGDLGLDSGIPQNVYVLPKGMTQVATSGPAGANKPAQVLAPGNSDPKAHTLTGLPKGYTLTVDNVLPFVTFQVKSDPYKKLVLLAAILIIVGLIMSLRVRRRRVWVRAQPDGEGRTLVEFGGLSRTDVDGFDEAFSEMASQLSRRLEGETCG